MAMSIIFRKSLKYVVLYCDQDQIETAKQKMNKLPFVKEILESYRPFLKPNLKIVNQIKRKSTIIKSVCNVQSIVMVVLNDLNVKCR